MHMKQIFILPSAICIQQVTVDIGLYIWYVICVVNYRQAISGEFLQTEGAG